MQNQKPNDESLPDYLKGVSDKTKIIPLSQATPLKAKLGEKGKGKPEPTVYAHVIKVEWLRQFSWGERLAILFGSNLVVQFGCATKHNPGAYQPLILGKVTHEKTPDAYMSSVVADMIEEKVKPSAIQHEPEQKREPEIR